MPFPGGAEAALEFAAYEKGLLEGGVPDRKQPVARQAPAGQPAPVGQYAPMGHHAPISEPERHSVRWMLAGAAMAVAVGAFLLLLSTGRLSAGFAVALRSLSPS